MPQALGEFLFPEAAPRTLGGIVRWWEKRRLAYNVMVGAAGLSSMAVVTTLMSVLEGRLILAPWQGAVLFGVLANVCYLLGPTTEILIDRIWGRAVRPIGPSLYRMGLTFSLGLALLPTLVAVFVSAIRVTLDSNFP